MPSCCPSRRRVAGDALRRSFTLTVGERTIEAGPGDIIVVPAGDPHEFLSRGERHRQLSIHPAARMETEWLE